MGWNGSGSGSTPQKPKVTAKKPSSVRGIAAGSLVCALAIGAYFVFFSGSDKPQAEQTAKERGRIKEVTPAAAPKAKPKELTAEEKEKLAHPGMVKAKNGVWHPAGIPYDPKWKHAHKVVTNMSAYVQESVAENATEQILFNIFSLERGDMPSPLPPEIPEDDLKHMAEIIMSRSEVSDKDSGLVAFQKDVMNAAKKALGEHIRNGGEIADFILDYQEELERCYMKKKDMQDYLDDMVEKGEDHGLIRSMTRKLNEKLASEGISPVDIPSGAAENVTQDELEAEEAADRAESESQTKGENK